MFFFYGARRRRAFIAAVGCLTLTFCSLCFARRASAADPTTTPWMAPPPLPAPTLKTTVTPPPKAMAAAPAPKKSDPVVDANASITITPPPPPPADQAPAEQQPASTEPASSSSVRMTYEATKVDRATNATPKEKTIDDSLLLHGFRLGYGYVMNYDAPSAALEGKTLKEKTGMRSPHHFLLGYEVVYRVASHSWLNVLLLGNAMIAGIEQSKFLPSGNLLIGAEINNSFQLGVGANLTPLKGSEAHVVAAAGWTPRVGSIYTPFHVYFIPDVDGVHKMGVTTGVTF